MGVQNEVEAQQHSWNVKKVGPWGRGLDGEGRRDKIARSGKVEQGGLNALLTWQCVQDWPTRQDLPTVPPLFWL